MLPHVLWVRDTRNVDEAKTAIVLACLPAGPLRDAYLDIERRGWTALMQAVLDGDEATVARLIANGADVDAIAEGAVTALSLACRSGSEPIVTMLLAAGADASVRAHRDYTVLHLAAAHSSLTVVRQLVAAGATVEAVGAETPLAVAIECDRIVILEYLVEQTLPWTEPSDAFGLACERGRLDAMRVLWDRFGAAVWSRNSPTPLMRAARGGNPQAIRFLIELGADVNEFDLKEDLSPLMHAATHGRYDAAKALLDGGASASCQTEWFVTAMRIAERRADGPMIELLRAHGAESTFAPQLHVTMPYAVYSTAVPSSPRRSTLEDALATDDVAALAQLDLEYTTEKLRAAARAKAPHCVAYLLASGADPHDADPSALAYAVGASDARAVRMMLAARPTALERTIAYAATDQSDPWILRAVLDRGADIDAPLYSQRPIELAAQSGRSAHLALLLARGARIDEDQKRESLLFLAARRGHVRCVSMLVGIGRRGVVSTGMRRIDVALLAAAEHPRVIELLVGRGADPEALDPNGDSLLHLAAWSSRVPIDLQLRLAGRYLNTPGRLGWMPLHHAAMAGTAQTIATLIRAGADVDARDSEGRTPLHLACAYPRASIIEALIAAAASLDLQAGDGTTPLHAAACVSPEPVRLLLAAGADPKIRELKGRTAVEQAEAMIRSRDYRTHAERLRALELLRAAVSLR